MSEERPEWGQKIASMKMTARVHFRDYAQYRVSEEEFRRIAEEEGISVDGGTLGSCTFGSAPTREQIVSILRTFAATPVDYGVVEKPEK